MLKHFNASLAVASSIQMIDPDGRPRFGDGQTEQSESMIIDQKHVEAVRLLKGLGFENQGGQWISPLERVGDELYRVLEPGWNAHWVEDEIEESRKAEHTAIMSAYSAARWPSGRRGRTTQDAVGRVEQLGYRFDGSKWQAPLSLQKSAIANTADELARKVSISMLWLAEHFGPDEPRVLALDDLLRRYRLARFTPDEIAEQDAVEQDRISYLDFLRGVPDPKSQKMT
jgi:hypothetical protein